MKIITNYNTFLKENINLSQDIFNILDLIKKEPTDVILQLRDSIEELSTKNENINENFVTDFIQKLKIKFKKTIDNRIWKYIINKKQKFYYDLVEKMNIFDITNLDDIFKNYPGFKIESTYMAGGMDKLKDLTIGWRVTLEKEFEQYPGKETNLPEINLKDFGTVEPKRVVDGIYLDLFLKNPTKIKKLYNKPLLLNPVRKEVDRTKDPDFLNATRKYKFFTQETEPEEYEPTLTNIRRTLSRTIEVDDENLVRISDFIFLGLNRAAAAGTYGELQMQSFMNKPIFVWMTDPEWVLGPTEKEPYGGFSLWTFPHITKLARNEDEMKILVSTIMNYVK